MLSDIPPSQRHQPPDLLIRLRQNRKRIAGWLLRQTGHYAIILAIVAGSGFVSRLLNENKEAGKRVSEWDKKIGTEVHKYPWDYGREFYRNVWYGGLFQVRWGVVPITLYPHICKDFCIECTSLLGLDQVKCSLKPTEINTSGLNDQPGQPSSDLCALAEARCFEVNHVLQPFTKGGARRKECSKNAAMNTSYPSRQMTLSCLECPQPSDMFR